MSYHFSYSEQGTYGHVVELVRRLPSRGGLVVDLGCGFGAVAEPLSELGFDYVGIDVDPAGLADLSARGFESHELDLWGGPGGQLAKSLTSIVGDRETALVLLLDVVEHCPDSGRFLDEVADALVALDRPLLVVSIPNVAHRDVAARLLAGEFHYTDSGLLDRTHVQLWTAARLHHDLSARGWLQVDANDLRLRHSDQHDLNHPLQAEHTPLGGWLSYLRSRVDAFGDVNQFVRAFALAPLPAPILPEQPEPTPPFLSVIMRTRGDRMGNLREALLCLAAQADEDFEAIVVVHHDDERPVAAVQGLVHEFSADFADRVRVRQARRPGRAHPLNVGLDLARGRYVAFLDDDDLVTADWVATFRAGAMESPGRIVRSLCVLQDVQREGEGTDAAYLVRSPFRAPYPERFDLIQHLLANQTPIHSFAVPRRLIELLSIRFDESLPVTEDWDFLLQVAPLAGVHDTREVTAIYHWWVDRTGSAGAAAPEVWSATRARVLARMGAQPLVLAPDNVAQLIAWTEENHALRSALADAQGQAAAAAAGLAAYERSRVWKATGPVRRGLSLGRRAARRGGLARLRRFLR